MYKPNENKLNNRCFKSNCLQVVLVWSPLTLRAEKHPSLPQNFKALFDDIWSLQTPVLENIPRHSLTLFACSISFQMSLVFIRSIITISIS
jgi:hypothetical protein